jgi:DNA-binding LacI/PurR family transcriptional regulator
MIRMGGQSVKKTIKDVARELNLAPSTISKVVNNKGRVSEETRKRVLKYVKESGYVAASNARILKSKISFTIGVIFSDISLVGLEHPFFSSILQAFKTYVESKGYEIVFIVGKIGDNELTYLQWCNNKKVDGVLIVMGNINNPNIIEIVNSDIPVVSTDIVMPNIHSIISDNAMGIKLALDFIEKQNYQSIGIIPGPLASRGFSERYEVFMEEINSRNSLICKPEHIVIAEGYGFNSGYNAGIKMVESSEELPEILLVGSDDLAFGVIRALESKKINVPNDISIIGFDDINFSELFTPSLTTIRQNRKEIGERAARKLLSLIENNGKEKESIEKIPVELVIRNSTNH